MGAKHLFAWSDLLNLVGNLGDIFQRYGFNRRLLKFIQFAFHFNDIFDYALIEKHSDFPFRTVFDSATHSEYKAMLFRKPKIDR